MHASLALAARPYRSHVARRFVEHAVRRGVDTRAIVDRLGVALEHAATVELPFETLVVLGERLAAAAGDPFFGLDAARHIPRGAYGVIEYVFATAATVGAGVELLLHFQALTSELARMTSARSDGRVAFEHRIDHPAARRAIHNNEFALATYAAIGERIMGRRPPVRAVRFMHDTPERRARLEDHFGAPVELGAERNALVFDDAFLALPLATADPTLFGIVAERAERELARAEPHGDLAAQVHAAYRRLVTARPRQAQALDVAAALGMSVRSMNRRLAEVGQSFRAIEADVKRALALEYLEQPRLSLTEIALLLGFADTSTFIRAFRRWTGTTPRQRAGAK